MERNIFNLSPPSHYFKSKCANETIGIMNLGNTNQKSLSVLSFGTTVWNTLREDVYKSKQFIRIKQ